MQRDYSLDLLKGLACLLMIFAHNTTGTAKYDWWGIYFLGGFAPILFYAVSGVVLTFQIKKKSRKVLILYYSALFLLGFSYNGIAMGRWGSEVFWGAEILQVLGLSSIVLVVLSKWVNIEKVSILFPLPFIIHLLGYYIPDFPFKEFLFRPGQFPLFPWLAFFMLGIYCFYSMRPKFNQIAMLIMLGFQVALILNTGITFDNKWDMSPGYFIVGVTFFYFSFLVIRSIEKYKFPFRNEFIFLGQNSLLFLFVHIFIGHQLFMHITKQPIIVWVVSLILTFVVMKALIWLDSQVKIDDSIYPFFWYGLICLLLSIPYLPPNYGYYCSYIVGCLLSLRYSKLNLIFTLPNLRFRRIREQKLSR
ncbi:acyltransferase family protein [Bacillus sp. V59.32b]|uniref:acyltransferase family protein n=1 Tax=Bacillus sp. V59.32b TaxID=1758642 RepID=UPI000E3D17B5|nr:acyltransferase family protein [Bacillus sp. V59.32b]RFU66836.1 hypothetical protein D0463_08830 [Bacillus sp. V59.32b]